MKDLNNKMLLRYNSCSLAVLFHFIPSTQIISERERGDWLTNSNHVLYRYKLHAERDRETDTERATETE